MKHYSKEERAILSIIGYVILEKNNSDYDKTYSQLDRMRITNIVYSSIATDMSDCVSITLHHPGLIIGARGSLIDAIKEEIEKSLKRKIDINLIEDCIDDLLYPMHPDDIYELGSGACFSYEDEEDDL